MMDLNKIEGVYIEIQLRDGPNMIVRLSALTEFEVQSDTTPDGVDADGYLRWKITGRHLRLEGPVE